MCKHHRYSTECLEYSFRNRLSLLCKRKLSESESKRSVPYRYRKVTKSMSNTIVPLADGLRITAAKNGKQIQSMAATGLDCVKSTRTSMTYDLGEN